MGTHPIFESDFDCLTECHELVPGNASKLTTVWPLVKPSVPPKLNWPHLPMLYPLLPTPSPEPTSKLNVATNTMARNLKLSTKPLLDLKAKDLAGDAALLAQLAVPKETCIPMIMEAEGSFFTINSFTSGRVREQKKLISVVSRRVASTSVPASCQICECKVTSPYHMKASNICKPCK